MDWNQNWCPRAGIHCDTNSGLKNKKGEAFTPPSPLGLILNFLDIYI